MEQFLIKIIEKTDGWVLLLVWISYLGYRIYISYIDEKALNKTLTILEDSIKNQFTSIVSKLEHILLKQ